MSETHGAAQKPQRRRPLTCALGCGGLLIIVLGAGGFYVYQKLRFFMDMTAESPIAFQVAPVAPDDAARAEEKTRRLKAEKITEISFTAHEINAILQNALKEAPAQREAKVRVDFEPGDRIRFRTTSAWETPILGKRYANVDFLGKLRIENGKVVPAEVERFIVGEQDRSADVNEILEAIQSELATINKFSKEPQYDPAAALRRIERLYVDGGQLHLKLKPEALSEPEKQ